MKKLLLISGIFSILATPNAYADQNAKITRLSKELANLRIEVDRLDGEVRAKRTEHLAELRTIERRRQELALLKDAALLKKQSLKQKIEQRKESKIKNEASESKLIKAIDSGALHLKQSLNNTLPFRKIERLKALDDLVLALRTKRIDPARAAVRLWRLIEDELRLTMTIERAQIPITIDGHRRLVHVLRLGTVTLFTKLADNRYGQMFLNDQGQWEHKNISSSAAKAQVEKLFLAVKRQLLDGAYRLPLPALKGASK